MPLLVLHVEHFDFPREQDGEAMDEVEREFWTAAGL